MPLGGAPFFAKTVKVLLQMDAAVWLTAEDRAETWEHVAFYNYVQEIVGDGPGQRPTHEMWLAAERPFLEVVEALRPQVVLALGRELQRRMPALPADVTVCHIQHPSTAFSYAKWNPRFAEQRRSCPTRTSGSPSWRTFRGGRSYSSSCRPRGM
jgi:uracil-DNA glycosylase